MNGAMPPLRLYAFMVHIGTVLPLPIVLGSLDRIKQEFSSSLLWTQQISVVYETYSEILYCNKIYKME